MPTGDTAFFQQLKISSLTLILALPFLILSLSSFKIEIAKTPQEIRTGLMYRDSIDDDTAMLFKFPKKQHVHLWMYNVNFDIDVAFLDDNFTVLEIKSLKSYPHIKDETFFKKRILKSTVFVKYALEANKGFFDRHDIHIGDSLSSILSPANN